MLTLKNVTKSYNGKLVLDNISLKIKRGERVAILGGSGSGKTTLAKIALALIKNDSGEIWLDGINLEKAKESTLKKQRYKYQYIFQNTSAMSSKMTVLDIIAEPLTAHKVLEKSQIKQYITNLLNDYGLEEKHLSRKISELSGGERQRVNILRAVALKPELIICDEITSALDNETAFKIAELLKNQAIKSNTTLVVITHSEELADFICTRKIGIKDGKICKIMQD